MFINLAVIGQFCLWRPDGQKPKFWLDAVAPGFGFLFCLLIWLSLPHPAKLAGGIWLAMGVVYLALMTGGFRKKPSRLDFPAV